MNFKRGLPGVAHHQGCGRSLARKGGTSPCPQRWGGSRDWCRFWECADPNDPTRDHHSSAQIQGTAKVNFMQGARANKYTRTKPTLMASQGVSLLLLTYDRRIRSDTWRRNKPVLLIFYSYCIIPLRGVRGSQNHWTRKLCSSQGS